MSFEPPKGEKTHYHLLHEAITLLEGALPELEREEFEIMADKIRRFLTQAQIKKYRGTV